MSTNITVIESHTTTTGERILFHIPLLIFYICILVFGIFGNVLVLYIYSRRLKIPIFGFFVKLLALFDLVTPCVLIPCLMVFRFAPHQIDTKIMCKVLTFMKHFNAVNSGLIFIIIAFQRYQLICKPHSKQMSVNLAKWLCVGSVCLSVIGSVPILLYLRDRTVFVTKGTHTVYFSICDFKSTAKDSSVSSTVYSIWIVIELVAVITTLVVLYILLGRALRRYDSRTSRRRRPGGRPSQSSQTRASTVSFFILTVIFLITATPMALITTYFSHKTVNTEWSYIGFIFFDLGVDLLFINSVVNPFVYSFTSTTFRMECKAVLLFWNDRRKRWTSRSHSTPPNVCESVLNS